MKDACIEECDDLILWFSEGKYVTKAMELKMRFTPLTAAQQESYNKAKGVPVRAVEIPKTVPVQMNEPFNQQQDKEIEEILNSIKLGELTQEAPSETVKPRGTGAKGCVPAKGSSVRGHGNSGNKRTVYGYGRTGICD